MEETPQDRPKLRRQLAAANGELAIMREALAISRETTKRLTEVVGCQSFSQEKLFRLTTEQSQWVKQNDEIRQCVERNLHLEDSLECGSLIRELEKILGI